MSGHRPVPDGAPDAWPRDAATLLLALLFGVFILLVIRTAWLSDDAFITLRVVENAVNGYGLRWNVAERVQVFTHPLWALLLTGTYAVTREAYFTTLALSMACAFSAVWLLAWRLAVTPLTAALALTTLIFSKAFVEYSTSGLENALTFLLLAVFFARSGRVARVGADVGGWLVAGLVMANRLDTGLLVLPVLAAGVWETGWRRSVRPAVLGLAPLAAWHLFALVYYGVPFPNTAYAKLQTGIPSGELSLQGLLYLLDSLARDPVTILVTVVATATAVTRGAREAWPMAIGIALYYAYVVRIGGDFMSGRFLAAPLLCALVMFSRVRWDGLARVAPAVAAVIVLLGWQATTRPPVTSGADTFIVVAEDGIGASGVADERAFYYRYTGLLRWSRELPLPHSQEVVEGRDARAAGGVVVRHSVGLFGYAAGPGVHVVDKLALADPLLARLPAEGAWRVGHYARRIPDGYVETLETGENRIADPAVAMLFERVATVTRGPVWSMKRWREIGRINGIW